MLFYDNLKGPDVQSLHSGSCRGHKTAGFGLWAMCCQSSLLSVDPSVQSKYAAVEICVLPIVWQHCTDVSSFSTLGGSAGLKPLYYDAFCWVGTYIH